MSQMYFLSVCVNFFGGFLLTLGSLENRFDAVKQMKSSFENKTLRVVTGILALVIGFLKLFVVYSVNDGGIIVFGDLLPAITGLALGTTLVVEVYKERSDGSSEILETLDNTLLKYSTLLGFAGIAVSILHFLFANTVIL